MFPNLIYAMALRGLLNYQLAAEVDMHESRFSRCARGRLAFKPEERAKIAAVLKFDTAWLFARPTPPRGKEVTGPGSLEVLAAS